MYDDNLIENTHEETTDLVIQKRSTVNARWWIQWAKNTVYATPDGMRAYRDRLQAKHPDEEFRLVEVVTTTSRTVEVLS